MIALGLAVLAALRVAVFAAAFPLFSNVDEVQGRLFSLFSCGDVAGNHRYPLERAVVSEMRA